MGHYASEMQGEPTPEETELATRAMRIEEEGKKIPLDEFLVGELPEVMRLNASGLLVNRNSDKYDSERMEWWEVKIRAWKEKQERENRGPHILKSDRTFGE